MGSVQPRKKGSELRECTSCKLAEGLKEGQSDGLETYHKLSESHERGTVTWLETSHKVAESLEKPDSQMVGGHLASLLTALKDGQSDG
jgi:hypothetical protein